MDRAIARWTAAHKCCDPETLAFLKSIQKSYVVYGDMLLLSSSAYARAIPAELQGIRQSEGDGASTGLHHLYTLIAGEMKITHVATTKPIPPSQRHETNQTSDNVLRAPLDFTPLYGDFGPSTCATHFPTAEDFSAAYWVTAKQNHLYQTWSPRWTMFSRGNITEKTRLLSLPSVLSAVADGEGDGRGCAAVDLYVGIGYFAFSYLKAGVKMVVGWDLNAWSVEGARKGAGANGWEVVVAEKEAREMTGAVGHLGEVSREGARLILFNEDNTWAGGRIEQMRACGALPPVRHVNCGLLPTSAGSWGTAVDVLDEGYDGWLHVHENFAVDDIAQKADEVREQIQRLADEATARGHGPENAGRRLVGPQHHPSQYTRRDIEPLARKPQRLGFYTPHHRVPEILESRGTLASLVLLSVQPIHSAEISSGYSPPQSSAGPSPPAAPPAVRASRVSENERCLSLWGSVFAPGPTPTLLVATNVTFATLQAVLLALLIGTYSIHFAVLSVLCCGLWCSINWFANELRQAQGIEEEAERLRKQSAALKERRGEVADSEADDEGEGTETEGGPGMSDSIASMEDGRKEAMENIPPRMRESQAVGGASQAAAREAMTTGTAPRGAMARDGTNTARQRMTESQDRSGDVSSSTDSEWEKVEGDR
ncbi:S-adenosylmethionine-dependent methyltransferase [Friedmanniomyces endolithicus]|nr:S-adenosylmethionine-dependent methyltransferase [Friedmanniomyces endolithicus]